MKKIYFFNKLTSKHKFWEKNKIFFLMTQNFLLIFMIKNKKFYNHKVNKVKK